MSAAAATIAVIALLSWPVAGLALEPYDDFSAGAIDESKWVIDTDSGYQVEVKAGALRIYNPKVSGSDGPSDGLASREPHARWSVDITPKTLHAGEELDHNQMIAIYLAQSEKRGSPHIAFGFIADPDNEGKALLVHRRSADRDWTVDKRALPTGTPYTLETVYDDDAEKVELYFSGELIATIESFEFKPGAPHLILRTGGWEGLVAEEIEGYYDRVLYAD